MASQRTLALSWEQWRELAAHRDHDPRPYVRERCAALLKIAEGKAPYWVARHGLLKGRRPDTVYQWLAHHPPEGLSRPPAAPQASNRHERLRPPAGGRQPAKTGTARKPGGATGGLDPVCS